MNAKILLSIFLLFGISSLCMAIDECGGDSLIMEFFYHEDREDVVRYETDTAVYYLNVKTDRAMLVSYFGPSLHVAIPDVVVWDDLLEFRLISIGRGAFADNDSIKEVVIPEHVSYIGNGAFRGCTNLSEIKILCKPENISFIDFVGTKWYEQLPSGPVVIDYDYLFCYKDTVPSQYVIPDSIRRIGNDVFCRKSELNEVILHENVSWMGNAVFCGCTGLKEIMIPRGVKRIGDEAFSGCSSLKEIILSDGLEEIGYLAFWGCVSLKEVDFPASLLKTDLFVNNDDSLEIIRFKSALPPVFPECLSSDPSFFDSELWKDFFSRCQLYVPEGSVDSYKSAPFWNQFKILSEYNPYGYKSDFCNDTIYYTVQPGGAMVSAREVNRDIFRDKFGFDGPLTPRDPIAGGQQPRTPSRAVSLSQTGTDSVPCSQTSYSGNLVIPESVSANDTTYRVVGTDYYAFIGCTELETVSFPESVTTLGYGSFAGCIGLKGVNIPSGVVSVPDAMFYGCTSLDGVVLPEGIATIGHSAFYNCSGLTEIVIPASVELIDEYAFFGCTGLKRIVIEGNPEIAPTAFLDCGTGQTNRFVNPDKKWICRWSSTNPQLQAKSFPVKYYFYGDTLISGKECLKLQLEWNDEPVRCIAAFYEEEGKVYYYPSRNSTEPALMYDFTASVGDSLHLSSPGNGGWPDSTENPASVGGEPGSYDFLVTSVSDTIINMYQLSVTTLENGVTPPVKIINGIGTLSGPLNLVGYSGYSVQLDSCRIGDKTIFSMSPAASKQPHDTLLFCGFEHGESNYVISNKAVRPDGSTDEVKVVTDETGAYYQKLLGLLGSDNVGNENKSFLRWKTGGRMSGAGCNPEDASLTLGGFNLESGQRYAVDFTFSDIDGGDMAVGIYHMTPDGLEPVKGPGISPDGSLEYCYHNDHNINRYRLMFMSESDYEDCCLRFSFLSPGKTYEIDNIALLEPVLCEVSYNGDIARIKFTPGNNVGEMASLAPEGAVEIPAGCVTLEAELNGEPYGLDVMTAEYHKDGYLYIWLDDDGFDGLEKIRLSFRNPVDDPSIALKYIKEINHATNDTVWALMPDLIQQRAFYNPEVSVSYKTVSWLVKSNLYDFKDTGAPSDLDSITMSFRAALAPDFEESIVAQLVNADGWRYSEPWYVSDYIVDVDSDDYETYTVVFRRDSLNNPDKKLLTGNYIFKVENVRFRSACHHIMTDYSVPVYFGGTNSIGREAEAVSRKEMNRHYGLDGRIIPADSPGLHIIRRADGTVHKVLVPYQSFHPSLQSGRE